MKLSPLNVDAWVQNDPLWPAAPRSWTRVWAAS